MTEHQSFSRDDLLEEAITVWFQAFERGEKPSLDDFLEEFANVAKEKESFSDNETIFQKSAGTGAAGDRSVPRKVIPPENGGAVVRNRVSAFRNESPPPGTAASVQTGKERAPDDSYHRDGSAERKSTINSAGNGYKLNVPAFPGKDEHQVNKANSSQSAADPDAGQLLNDSLSKGVPTITPGLVEPDDNSELTPAQVYSPQSTKTERTLIPKEIGSYWITGELGRGGMGVVYKARHKTLQRDVALKMILKANHDERILSRFRFEAQSLATLKHQGIVEIYEYGEEDGIPWFALEFVEGKTLSQLTNKEPIEPTRAAKIVADLASAIAYAHDKGVLHRDIKPSNVLVANGDIAKLTDYGLAKRESTDDSDDEISEPKTIDGQVLGTPGYMPPEQARGDHKSIGNHSDQYSLGATLYYLLTGRAPFVGRPLEFLLSQVIENDPLSVRQLQPTIPLDLETICLKAMSKEPLRRYPDCAAMEADLRRFLSNEPIVARPISGIERSIRWCRRNPRVAIPIATAVFSLMTALSVSVWSAVTLSKKNADIEQQKNLAVAAKNLADQNAEIARTNAIEAERNAEAARENAVEAEKNAETARKNAKLAYERAVQSKDSILQMLLAIRETVPTNDKTFRLVREQLLQIASKQLDLLPDESGDRELRTGLEKARVLQERFLTALELGQPSKAIVYLDEAEEILRKRNQSQSTDVTRLNLTKLLRHQAHARSGIRRDMERVRKFGEESLQILGEILAFPKPEKFDIPHGSVLRTDTLRWVMIQGYQHSLTLKKLGRVQEAFDVINLAISHFDEAMAILRNGPLQQLGEEGWAQKKQEFRGMLSDQDLLRIVLLGSIGREQEAVDDPNRILDNVRQIVERERSRENWAKLSLALVFAGDIARQRGQLDSALASYEESVKITRELYQDDPSLEDRRNRHQISLARLAGLLRSRDLSRARQLYAEAQQVAQEMVNADSESITHHVALALVSPFSGPPAKAVEQAEDILKRSVPGDAEMFIDLARVWSAAAKSELLSESPDFHAIDRWKQEALKRIEDAVADGYSDRAYLLAEPDFEAIKTDEKFQKLVGQSTAVSQVVGPQKSE